MKRGLLVLLLVIFSSITTACFWKKKPKTVQTPPPPRRTSAPARTGSRTSSPPVERTTKPPEASTPKRAGPEPPTQPGVSRSANLGQLLSPAERAQLDHEMSQSLINARRNLAVVSGANLNPSLAEKRKLVQAFIVRAERTRQSDLTLAAQLARRAELLAQSLAASVR
jgi:hypothetical protein